MDPDLVHLPPPPREVPFAVGFDLHTNGGLVFAALWLGVSSLVLLALAAGGELGGTATAVILVVQLLGVLILLAAHVYANQRIRLLRSGVLGIGTVTRVVVHKTGPGQKGFAQLPPDEAVRRHEACLTGGFKGDAARTAEALEKMKQFHKLFGLFSGCVFYTGLASLVLFFAAVAFQFPVAFNRPVEERLFLLTGLGVFIAAWLLIGTIIRRGHRGMMTRLSDLTSENKTSKRVAGQWPDVFCECTYTLDNGETATASDRIHLLWLADYGPRCPILYDPQRPRLAMLLVGPRVPAGVSPQGEWEPLTSVATSFVRLVFIVAGLGATGYAWVSWPWR